MLTGLWKLYALLAICKGVARNEFLASTYAPHFKSNLTTSKRGKIV